MNVYVIVLAQMGDFYWYILDEENWAKLDDREFCEQIHEVDLLVESANIQETFDLIRENGWVVADSAEGVSY